MNQSTKPDNDFLPLPQYSIAQGGRKYYSEDAMHDYVIADRAARQPVAESVDTPEFRELLGYVQGWADGKPILSPDSPVGRASLKLIAHINALIAPAAPSGEAETSSVTELNRRLTSMGVTKFSYTPGTNPNASSEQVATEILRALDQMDTAAILKDPTKNKQEG